MSSDHLARHRREESARKHQAVLDAIPRILARGDAVTPTTVAVEAGVTRPYIYKHLALREAVEAARGQQDSPRTEPAQLRALKVETARLRERLKVEQKTTLDLRRQLRRAWGSAIEDVPQADLTQRITELETRNGELTRQLRAVEDNLAEKVALLEQAQEQLESVRQVNRDLIRQRNK